MTFAPRVRASKGRHVGLGRMQPVPRVSIIIPCYNGEAYIGRTIDSVRAQAFTDWEHVVVDDGSTDNSAAVIETYVACDPRLRLIRQPNGGVAKARNNSFAACSAESDYLLFLDADDCLEPEMLAVMVSYLDAHPDVGLAYCRCLFIDSDDSVTGKKEVIRYAPDSSGVFSVREIPPDCPETPFVSVFVYAVIVPSVAVLRRSVYELTPGWDETLGQPAEDTDLFLHMALRSRVHYVPQELVRKRQHGMQSTRDRKKIRAQGKKLYRKWNSMSGLSEDHKALVEEARRFREGRILPSLNLKWGGDHLRAGNLVEGLKCYMRFVKQLLSHTVRVRLVGG